jgi:hypothetical protein
MAIEVDGQDGPRAYICATPPKTRAPHEFQADVEIRMFHGSSGDGYQRTGHRQAAIPATVTRTVQVYCEPATGALVPQVVVVLIAVGPTRCARPMNMAAADKDVAGNLNQILSTTFLR